jgi:hypothetical protein
MNSAKETRGIERGKARRLQPLEVSPIAWSIMVAFMLLAVLLMPATAADIFTVAGTGLPGSSGDGGPATNAELNSPRGVALDVHDNVFIADYSNNRIRRVDAVTSTITTIAGNGSKGYSGDGGPATAAKLNAPYAVALDAAGNLFIADERGTVASAALMS